jgi:hypothetical protein
MNQSTPFIKEKIYWFFTLGKELRLGCSGNLGQATLSSFGLVQGPHSQNNTLLCPYSLKSLRQKDAVVVTVHLQLKYEYLSSISVNTCHFPYSICELHISYASVNHAGAYAKKLKVISSNYDL